MLRWTAADSAITEEYRPSDFANGHTLDHDGTVLACQHGTRRVARYERDGSRTTIVDRYQGKRLNSPNDIVVASDGAIWFTDPPYGIVSDREGYTAESELGHCYVFRFDPASGDLAIVSDDLIDPNGLAFSPDERTLYVSDTSSGRVENGFHHILAFDVVDGRSLANARVFAEIDPGAPDGFRVDVEGNVWTSAGDGIHVLTPDGTELGRILLPEPAANCQFGGPDGRTLFITATSTLWSIEVGIRGAVTPWGRRPGPVGSPGRFSGGRHQTGSLNASLASDVALADGPRDRPVCREPGRRAGSRGSRSFVAGR